MWKNLSKGHFFTDFVSLLKPYLHCFVFKTALTCPRKFLLCFFSFLFFKCHFFSLSSFRMFLCKIKTFDSFRPHLPAQVFVVFFFSFLFFCNVIFSLFHVFECFYVKSKHSILFALTCPRKFLLCLLFCNVIFSLFQVFECM